MAVQSIQNKNEKSGGYKPRQRRKRRRFLRFLMRYPGWLLMRVGSIEGLHYKGKDGGKVVPSHLDEAPDGPQGTGTKVLQVLLFQRLQQVKRDGNVAFEEVRKSGAAFCHALRRPQKTAPASSVMSQ